MGRGVASGTRPALAAVVSAKDSPLDAFLAELVHQLVNDGVRVFGVLQESLPGESGARPRIMLRDAHDGSRTTISEDRGPLAVSCRLDNGGLADVAGRLSMSIEAEPDLLVLNRFGKTESEGGGFRDVIIAATLRGIPVLIGVREERVADWRRFHGGMGEELPPNQDAVLAWVKGSKETADDLRAA
jgi:hypothetical protein